MGPRDVECVRAVREVVAASLTKFDPQEPEDYASLLRQAVEAHTGPNVLGVLVRMADAVSKQIALSGDGSQWHAVARATRTRQVLLGARIPQLGDNGPMGEFAVIAFGMGSVPPATTDRWVADAYLTHGNWSIRAGIEIVCQLLESRGGQTGDRPLGVLQTFALAEEGALSA